MPRIVMATRATIPTGENTRKPPYRYSVAKRSWARWLATVYNGVDVARLRFHARPGRYLVFLGRISPEKGLDRATRENAALAHGVNIRRGQVTNSAVAATFGLSCASVA